MQTNRARQSEPTPCRHQKDPYATNRNCTDRIRGKTRIHLDTKIHGETIHSLREGSSSWLANFPAITLMTLSMKTMNNLMTRGNKLRSMRSVDSIPKVCSFLQFHEHVHRRRRTVCVFMALHSKIYINVKMTCRVSQSTST